MEEIEHATFDCFGCGNRAAVQWVTYDALGYAECPSCSRSVRPF